MQLVGRRSPHPVGFFLAVLGVAYALWRRCKQKLRTARAAASVAARTSSIQNAATNHTLADTFLESSDCTTALPTKPASVCEVTKALEQPSKAEDVKAQAKGVPYIPSSTEPQPETNIHPALDPRLKLHIEVVLDVRQRVFEEIGHASAIRVFFNTLADGPASSDEPLQVEEESSSSDSLMIQFGGLLTLMCSVVGVWVLSPETVQPHIVTIFGCLVFSLCLLVVMEWGANKILAKLMVAGHAKLTQPLARTPAQRAERPPETNGRIDAEAHEEMYVGRPMDFRRPPTVLEEYQPTSVTGASVRVGNTNSALVQKAVSSWSSAKEEGRLRGVIDYQGKTVLVEVREDSTGPGHAIFTQAFLIVPHMDWMGRGVIVEAYLPCLPDLRTRPSQAEIDRSAKLVVATLKSFLPASLTASQHAVS